MSPCVVNDTNFATLVAACISSSCSNAPCANIAAWDTSSLTALAFPIAAANVLGDIGGWDVSNVRDMSNFVNGSDALLATVLQRGIRLRLHPWKMPFRAQALAA
jgi:hypothetical protein